MIGWIRRELKLKRLNLGNGVMGKSVRGSLTSAGEQIHKLFGRDVFAHVQIIFDIHGYTAWDWYLSMLNRSERREGMHAGTEWISGTRLADQYDSIFAKWIGLFYGNVLSWHGGRWPVPHCR